MQKILFFTVLIGLATAYSGDLTYYATGVGSCGTTSTDNDAVVALSLPMMANNGNPNTNPKCGSQISIHNPTTGQTAHATVVDTCQACAVYDIDVSGSLFTTLAGGLSAGRVPVDWVFQEPGPKLEERRRRIYSPPLNILLIMDGLLHPEDESSMQLKSAKNLAESVTKRERPYLQPAIETSSHLVSNEPTIQLSKQDSNNSLHSIFRPQRSPAAISRSATSASRRDWTTDPGLAHTYTPTRGTYIRSHIPTRLSNSIHRAHHPAPPSHPPRPLAFSTPRHHTPSFQRPTHPTVTKSALRTRPARPNPPDQSGIKDLDTRTIVPRPASRRAEHVSLARRKHDADRRVCVDAKQAIHRGPERPGEVSCERRLATRRAPAWCGVAGATDYGTTCGPCPSRPFTGRRSDGWRWRVPAAPSVVGTRAGSAGI